MMMTALSEAAAAVSESASLSIVAKATFAVLVSLGATWAIPRARASIRHLMLAVTFAGLLIMPVAGALAPGIDIEVAAGEAARVSPEKPAASDQFSGPAGTLASHASTTGRRVMPGLSTLARHDQGTFPHGIHVHDGNAGS